MAHTSKGRTLAKDNIAVGSATGIENTVAVAAPPPVFTDTFGNIENIAVGTDYGADENVVAVAVSMGIERLTA